MLAVLRDGGEVRRQMLGKGLMTGLAACCLVASVAGWLANPVQYRVESRGRLPNCGKVTLKQDATLEQDGGEKLACLTAAFESGKAAESKVQQFTQEGDPVTEYYRVTDKGTTELYVDSTKDPNADKEWSFGGCD